MDYGNPPMAEQLHTLNYQDVCLNPTLAGSAGIIQASFGSTRGVHETALDPSSSNIIYAAPFPQNNALPLNTKGGVWRSTDSGASWTQIKNALNADAKYRSSVVCCHTNCRRKNANVCRRWKCRRCRSKSSTPVSHRRCSRSRPTQTSPTSLQCRGVTAADQTLNYCGDPAVGGAQCWYDNVVYSPPGKPDVVYLGGSYTYSRYGFRNNGRAFVRSTNAGVSFTDMTWDATTNPTPPDNCCQPNAIAPNGMHPDSHAIVEIPGTDSAIFGSDGGLVRSSGTFVDISSQCQPPVESYESCDLPADAFCSAITFSQPEQRTINFAVPEFVG